MFSCVQEVKKTGYTSGQSYRYSIFDAFFNQNLTFNIKDHRTVLPLSDQPKMIKKTTTYVTGYRKIKLIAGGHQKFFFLP